LRKALDLGKAAIPSYYSLAYGRASDRIPGPEFRDLVTAIGKKSGGVPVGLQILSMRLHSDRTDKRETVPEVAEAGRALLAAFELCNNGDRANREDHDLGIVARTSLSGPEGEAIARRLCHDLMAGVSRYEVHASDHDGLVAALLRTYPATVLDELFSGDEKARRKSVHLLRDQERHRHFVLGVVSDDAILDWCDQDPATRFPIAASIGSVFTRSNNGEPQRWKPLATRLLERAPDPPAVLSEIAHRVLPSGGWSGSLATVLESSLKLLEELPIGDLPTLAAPLEERKAALRQRIEQQRRQETAESRARSSTFE
jgi:hypothetical protein